MLLRSFRIDPARGGDRIERLPFLSHGPVEVQLGVLGSNPRNF